MRSPRASRWRCASASPARPVSARAVPPSPVAVPVPLLQGIAIVSDHSPNHSGEDASAAVGLRQTLQVAAAVAGAQDYPRGCLYVVATPIGNLADIGLRALHALSLVDAIACEDTRTSGALLRHFGLEKPLLALH